MRVVDLNRPALWRPIRSQETSVRKYSGAYPYSKGGIILQSTLKNPVIRYAKNFQKFELDFCLFIFTDEKDMDKVERFFENIVSKIKKKDITDTLVKASMSDFLYLNTLYGGSK